jgi:hypothetical protein
MGFFGNLLGQAVGGLGGGLFGHRDTGAQIGGTLGNLLPFRHGGRVGIAMREAPAMKRGGKAHHKKHHKREESPETMRRGGKAHLKKGSKAMKEKMARLRAMRK